jgi:hypothetical protein
MAKSNPYLRKPVHPPTEHLVDGGDDPSITGRDSGSQSPQARRGSAQDFGKFRGDRKTNMNIANLDDTDNAHAWDRATPLNIEKTNPKK